MAASLRDSNAYYSFDPDEEKLVKLLQNQFENVTKQRPTYNLDTFELSYLLRSKSSAAYNAIRERSCLKLPHPRHLQRILRSFNIRPDKKQENIEYLKTLLQQLPEKARIINLSGDEVYLRKGLTFRNGCLRGFAQNKPHKYATTCFVIYANSIFGNFGEVYNVVPVTELTSKDMEEYFNEAIKSLQEIGFIVTSISLDGNRVNQKFYSEKAKMSDSEYYFPNPTIPGASIYMFFDSLHIYKNLRNNWIAKETSKDNAMPPKISYPNFDNDDGTENIADFEDLREILKENQTAFRNEHTVFFNAFGLTPQALYPSTYDRQREKFVRAVFNERVSAELRRRGKIGTAVFIELVTNWEHLMNSKSKVAGKRSRIVEKEPYTSANDPKIEILSKYLNWFKRWRAMRNCTAKKLSNDTFRAVIQTTQTMILYVNYIFKNFNPE